MFRSNFAKETPGGRIDLKFFSGFWVCLAEPRIREGWRERENKRGRERQISAQPRWSHCYPDEEKKWGLWKSPSFPTSNNVMRLHMSILFACTINLERRVECFLNLLAWFQASIWSRARRSSFAKEEMGTCIVKDRLSVFKVEGMQSLPTGPKFGSVRDDISACHSDYVGQNRITRKSLQ